MVRVALKWDGRPLEKKEKYRAGKKNLPRLVESPERSVYGENHAKGEANSERVV